jgi:hypothetical protein
MPNPLLWAVIIDLKELPFRSYHFLCLDAKKVTKEKSRLQKNGLKFTAFRDNE